MNKKLWGGRFRKKTDPAFDKFSASLKWDWRLAPYDLAIDAAHVKALRRCGVLSAGACRKLLGAVDAALRDYGRGKLPLDRHAEDVHSAIEAALVKRAGADAVSKLHTGRSRNDLVSQSTRLFCKHHSGRIAELIRSAQKALLVQAERHREKIYGGMTHLQIAQPVLYAHVLLSYAEMLERSREKLERVRESSDVCVLGSGALAGVPLPLDQKFIARQLGLSRITSNSYDVAGDRDFVLDFLYAIASTGIQLSRIAEDLLVDKTRANSVMEMDESFCTGSSMMPHKKNPDFAELVRGGGAVFLSNLVGFAVTLKGLPTSYNRDLQWDKSFLFDSVEQIEEVLEMFARFVNRLEFPERQQEKIKRHFLEGEGQYGTAYATDLAYYLVQKGVSFKKAHDQVGQIVRFAESTNVSIPKIGLDILSSLAPEIDGDVYAIFDPARSVSMKKTIGSTNPNEVAKQIRKWKIRLKSNQKNSDKR